MFAVIPVLLVSDDPLVRSGVAALLPEDQPVVRGVGTGVDLPRVLADVGAEVVVWDTGDDGEVQVADGVPSVALVKDGEAGARALRAGARAVLLRDLVPLRLAAAVVGARHGLVVVDERLRDEVLTAKATAAEPSEGGPMETVEALTGREVEVLNLLAEGRSNREIGVALEISPHTSKFHVDRILAKLTASSRTDAVVRAVRLGLLTL
jgi:two-component system, NarL family, nitrate/nitrite response regulator NarL